MENYNMDIHVEEFYALYAEYEKANQDLFNAELEAFKLDNMIKESKSEMEAGIVCPNTYSVAYECYSSCTKYFDRPTQLQFHMEAMGDCKVELHRLVVHMEAEQGIIARIIAKIKEWKDAIVAKIRKWFFGVQEVVTQKDEVVEKKIQNVEKAFQLKGMDTSKDYDLNYNSRLREVLQENPCGMVMFYKSINGATTQANSFNDLLIAVDDYTKNKTDNLFINYAKNPVNNTNEINAIYRSANISEKMALTTDKLNALAKIIIERDEIDVMKEVKAILSSLTNNLKPINKQSGANELPESLYSFTDKKIVTIAPYITNDDYGIKFLYSDDTQAAYGNAGSREGSVIRINQGQNITDLREDLSKKDKEAIEEGTGRRIPETIKVFPGNLENMHNAIRKTIEMAKGNEKILSEFFKNDPVDILDKAFTAGGYNTENNANKIKKAKEVFGFISKLNKMAIESTMIKIQEGRAKQFLLELILDSIYKEVEVKEDMAEYHKQLDAKEKKERLDKLASLRSGRGAYVSEVITKQMSDEWEKLSSAERQDLKAKYNIVGPTDFGQAIANGILDDTEYDPGGSLSFAKIRETATMRYDAAMKSGDPKQMNDVSGGYALGAPEPKFTSGDKPDYIEFMEQKGWDTTDRSQIEAAKKAVKEHGFNPNDSQQERLRQSQAEINSKTVSSSSNSNKKSMFKNVRKLF